MWSAIAAELTPPSSLASRCPPGLIHFVVGTETIGCCSHPCEFLLQEVADLLASGRNWDFRAAVPDRLRNA
jgi:hypothetical protein